MSYLIRLVLFAFFVVAVVLGQNSHAAEMDHRAIQIPAKAPLAAMKGMVKVRILIYSGRPDPEYVIPANQLQPFMKKAKRVSHKGKSIIPSVLGYKGVLVENPTKAGGLPEVFAVYNGKIEVEGKEKAFLTDEGRALEKFLVKEAVNRKAMGEDIFKRLKIEPGKENKEGDGKGTKE